MPDPALSEPALSRRPARLVLVVGVVVLGLVGAVVAGLTVLHRIVDASYVERQLEEQLSEAWGIEYEVSVSEFEFSIWRGYVEAGNVRFHPVADRVSDASAAQLLTVNVERVRIEGIKRWRLLTGNLTARAIHLDAPQIHVQWTGESPDDPSEGDGPSPRIRVETFTVAQGNLLLESAIGDSLAVSDINLTIQHLDSDPGTDAMRLIYGDDVALRIGTIQGYALGGDYVLHTGSLALSTADETFDLHDFLLDASPEEPWLDAIRVNSLEGSQLSIRGIDFRHFVDERDIRIQTVNLHEWIVDIALRDDSSDSGTVVTIDSLFVTNSELNLMTKDGVEISAGNVFGTAYGIDSSHDLAEYPLYAHHVEVQGSDARLDVGQVVITTAQLRGSTSTGNLEGDSVTIERPDYYTFRVRRLAAQGVDFGHLFAEGGFHVTGADAYDLNAHVILHPSDGQASSPEDGEQLSAQHLRVHSGGLLLTLQSRDELRFEGLSGEMTNFDLRTEDDRNRVLWSTDVRAEVDRLEGTLGGFEQRLDVRNVRAATEAGTFQAESFHLASSSLAVDSTGIRVDAGPVVLTSVDFPLFFHSADIDVTIAEVREPRVFIGLMEGEEDLDLGMHIRAGEIRVADGILTVRIPSGDDQRADNINGLIRGLDFGGEGAGRFLASEDIQLTAGRLRSTLQGGQLHMGGYHAVLSVADSTFTIQDAYVEPEGNDEEITRRSRVRRDSSRIRAPSVRLAGIDFHRLGETQDVVIRLVEVDSAAVAVYIDRDLSPDPDAGFPHQRAVAAEMIFQVDEVRVTNGRIEQREFAGGRRVGELLLSDVEVQARNVSNDPDIMTSDTPLAVEVRANLLEHAPLELYLAYPLRAQGFDLIYQGHLGPMDMEPLSEVLRGLAGIEVVSGTLDSLAWDLRGRGNVIERVLGDDQRLRWAESEDSPPILEGDLRFFYHDLEIRLVDSETGEQGFGNRILTFLANNLLVFSRNEASGDPEADARNVVYEIEPDDSFFDVLLNAVLDGVLSEVLFIRI